MSSGKYDVNIGEKSDSAYTAVGVKDSDTAGLLDFKSSNKGILWILIGILAASLVVVTIILLGVSIALGVKSNSSVDNVCLTEGCIQISAQISAALNQSVDPCDDFYQFSCGNWLKTRGIPQGFDNYNAFQNIPFDANKIALGKIFDADDDMEVAAVRKALDLYKACIDMDTINSRGAEPLKDLIRNTGGWSLVGISETEPWTINSTSFQNEKLYGSDAFFQYTVEIDPFNSSRYNIFLSQRGVTKGLSNTNAVRDYIVGVLSLIFPVSNNSAYVDVANGIIDLENTLSANFEALQPGNITQVYNEFTIGQFQSEIFPEMDWRGWLQSFFHLVDSSYTVTGNERVLIATPNYFRNLSSLYRNLTDCSILQHYAKWHLIQGYVPFLSDNFRQLLITFTQTISPGTPITTDQSLVCSIVVQKSLPIALARMYTEQVLPEQTKETLSMTTEMIREAFRQRLQMNTWLDDFSRQACVEKANAIIKMVAYPDDLLNDSYVNGFYANLTVDPADYFGNRVRQSELTNRANAQRFFDGVDRTVWPVNMARPTDVNAFYSPNLNEIIILEGILSPPAFNAKWPDYINFGAIGAVIGHEISHGFDTSGQRYNKDGNLRQWWSDEGIASFKSRLPCFVNQYNSYTVEGIQVNGQFTLGENIADNGGVNTAFRAHRNRVAQGGTTQTLPSLDYTIDQLFFIAYSQLWCTVYTPSGAQRLLTTDSHSPGLARVLGPLVNSPDFANTFNCPVGSKMNPSGEKCLLW